MGYNTGGNLKDLHSFERVMFKIPLMFGIQPINDSNVVLFIIHASYSHIA